MVELSEIQSAAVSEMLNIAIGRAASALNELVDEEVTLSIPTAFFVSPGKVQSLIDSHAGNGACAVMQAFDGPFSGNALLVFPEEKSLALVRLMIGDHVPIESMTELEQDALTEVGNILLNASLGTLADLLDLDIAGSLPLFVRGNGRSILGGAGKDPDADDLALLVEVDFDLRDSNISGYVLFILDVASAERFTRLIDAYLAKLGT